MLPLSVLDLSFVTTATSGAQALRNTLDLAQLADRLGVSFATVNRWEAGASISPWFNYAVDEFILVLEGEIIIVEKDRETRAGPGEALVIPKGTHCRYRQDRHVRKFYVYHGDPSAQAPASGRHAVKIDTAAALDPARTLVVVASKSGGTIEVTSLERYFRVWVERASGAAAGRQFVERLSRGEYAALESQFTDAMKAALPEDKLAATWTALTTQAGAFKGVTETRTEARGVLTVAVVNLAIGRRTFRPSIFGKAATATYILTAAAAVLYNYAGYHSVVVDVLVWASLAITLVSGMHYIWHAAGIINETQGADA
mgnify:CR=1 FL=1